MGEIDLLARGRPVRLPWDRSWTLTLRQHAPLFHIKDLHRAFQNRAHQPSCQAVLSTDSWNTCAGFRRLRSRVKCVAS